MPKNQKRVRIKKGQTWQHTDSRRTRRVYVGALSSLSCGRPYATVVNRATGKRTRISLDRLRPACGWRLVVTEPTTAHIPAANPVAAETTTL